MSSKLHLTCELILQVNNINRWYKPFYPKHVESFLSSVNPSVEYIPTRDYYHRYSRGIFFILSLTASVVDSPLYLFFFGWLFPANMNFLKLIAGVFVPCVYNKALSYFVIQDMIVPMTKFEEAWNLVDDMTGVRYLLKNLYQYFLSTNLNIFEYT